MVKLQLALDVLSTQRALEIAELTSCFDFLEAGTPLIKKEGMAAVEALRKHFPDHTIVADLKTADAGRLEVQMAAEAGADIVTALAVASDESVEEFIAACSDFKIKSMIDLLGAPLQRAVELKKADYIVVHTGIDQQARGKTPFKDLELVRAAVKTKIAVAGGIKLENIGNALRFSPDVIIVGAAVTKSPNPAKTAAEFVSMVR